MLCILPSYDGSGCEVGGLRGGAPYRDVCCNDKANLKMLIEKNLNWLYRILIFSLNEKIILMGN